MKGKVKGRLNRIFIILMCAMLAVCPVMTETVSAANTSKSNTTAKKRLSGWVTVQRGQVRYYRAGTYYKGCKRIGNYYHYFDSRGILLKKDTTVRGVTYYIESNGRVLGRKKGSQYYAPNGKRLNRNQATELRAYQNARKIVNKITNSKMSQSQKLKNVLCGWCGTDMESEDGLTMVETAGMQRMPMKFLSAEEAIVFRTRVHWPTWRRL